MLDGGVKRHLKKKTAWMVVGKYRGSALGREGLRLLTEEV